MKRELVVDRLLELSKMAYDNDEIPVGAIVVRNGKIIGEGINNRNKDSSVIGHAEVNAIEMACKFIDDWRLDDCDLYVTLEPCSMCKEVIRKSRIKNTYYFINQNEHLTEKEPNFIKIEDKINFSNKLTQFFKDKR